MYDKHINCGQTPFVKTAFTDDEKIRIRMNEDDFELLHGQVQIGNFNLGKLVSDAEWKALSLQYMIESGVTVEKAIGLIESSEAQKVILNIKRVFLRGLNDLIIEHC
jgi:hypothetical protein